jgi:hypothetical protein
MTVAEIVEPLQGCVAVENAASKGQPIGGVVASDLMSDVLVTAQENFLLVTSMASEQMIRTADFVGALGVVVVNDKPLTAAMLELARSLDMALVRSPLPKYEACLVLGACLGAEGQGGAA